MVWNFTTQWSAAVALLMFDAELCVRGIDLTAWRKGFKLKCPLIDGVSFGGWLPFRLDSTFCDLWLSLKLISIVTMSFIYLYMDPTLLLRRDHLVEHGHTHQYYIIAFPLQIKSHAIFLNNLFVFSWRRFMRCCCISKQQQVHSNGIGSLTLTSLRSRKWKQLAIKAAQTFHFHL